jgi:hypothetical protein
MSQEDADVKCAVKAMFDRAEQLVEAEDLARNMTVVAGKAFAIIRRVLERAEVGLPVTRGESARALRAEYEALVSEAAELVQATPEELATMQGGGE